MHIAICDDNVADRKQLERLLKRESDARATTTGVFYVDSYGHCESLLKAPMLYDAFFIDMCKDEVTGIDVMNSLNALGVSAPIILCSSDIRYQDFPLSDHVLTIDKPIKITDLSMTLDHAITLKQSAVSHIELRQESGTHYVTEDEILYCIAEGRYINIVLTSGQTIPILSTIPNLFDQLEPYPSFFTPNAKVIINGRHIQKIGVWGIVMTDGTKFSITPSYKAYAKYAYEEFHVKGKKS